MNRRGFTLIELLVVIAIVGLLASIVLSSLKTARDKAYNAKINSALMDYANILELYRLKYGSLPIPQDAAGNPITTYACLGPAGRANGTCGLLNANTVNAYLDAELKKVAPTLPVVSTKEIALAANSSFMGAIYRYNNVPSALDPSPHIMIDWYLQGKGQTCARLPNAYRVSSPLSPSITRCTARLKIN